MAASQPHPKTKRDRVLLDLKRAFIVTLILGFTNCCGLAISPAFAQIVDRKQAPSISDFHPQSNLKVKWHDIRQAKFPVIDIHTHFGFRLKGDPEALDKFVAVMDRNRIKMCVSLDAKLGKEEDHLKFLKKKYSDRFAVFCHLDFQGDGIADQPETWACNQPGFVREAIENLIQAKKKGIVGLKFFKQFGLGYKNPDGSLIKIDAPRFDPIWKKCGELGLPVIIHTGDPAAFFLPIDNTNERLEELSRHPDWSFYGDEFPKRMELLAARNRVIKKHRSTQFIGAHVAGNPEDLAKVGQWLDEMPNLSVELASRIGELGRQPITSRKFFIQYQDRILFGTDGPWPEQRLVSYWRFLETLDENFPYSEKTPPPQGLWNIYGIGLPDNVLKKIYFQNAIRLLPSIAQRFEKAAR